MKKVFSLLLTLLFIMTGCAGIPIMSGNTITVKKLVPAEINVSKYKKISVLDFDGRGGRQIAEWMENELQNARVDDTPFFEVISRSQMMKLLGEQMLSLKGFVDPGTASKMGKISGTQAVVTGTISSFVVRDGRYYKTVTRDDGRQGRVTCQVRDAYVEFTASFIDSTSGRVMAKTSAEGQYVGDSCQNMGGLAEAIAKSITDALFQSVEKKTDNIKVVPIDIPEKMLKGASMLAIEKFVRKITPYYEDVRIVLKKNDSDFNIKVWEKKPESEKLKNRYYDVGYKYAVRGQWEDAIEQWEKVLDINKLSPAAVYNIGIAFEMMGDLFLAEKQLKKACDLKADNDFFDALARVRKSLKEKKDICQQTGKGCPKKRYTTKSYGSTKSATKEKKIKTIKKEVKSQVQEGKTEKNNEVKPEEKQKEKPVTLSPM